MVRKRTDQSSQDILQNSIKTLLANIRFASVDDPITSMVLTSSVPNEGKSTISVALAEAIATSGHTVLLIECDMRRRTLAGRLGVHPTHGLYAVLSGQAGLTESAAATRTPRMYFIDAEPHIPNPADILASRRFRRFVEEARAAYDYVIFDTPPVGPFVDAAVVSSVVDATILVVRERFTKRADVLNAREQLEKAGANLIGVVLNGCAERENDYYYDYYTKDDKKKEQAPSAAPLPAEAPRAPRQAPRGARAAAPAAGSAQAPQPVQPARGHAVQPRPVAPASGPVATSGKGVAPDSTAAFISSFRKG